MKTPKTSLNHGLAAAQGRVMGTRAVGGLAAVTAADGTVLRVAELDFTGSTIEEVETGVVQVSGEAQVGHYNNNTGSDLEYGDVVVLDSTGDKSITTTATPQDTRPVGVVQGPIANGEVGLVAWSGDVPFIKVTAAVTRGYYAETSDEAGKATENPDPRVGSFGIYLTDGTEPACHLFGSSRSVHDHGLLDGLEDDDHPLYALNIRGGEIVRDAHGNLGVASTLDAEAGNYHTGTLNDDCAIDFAGFTAGTYGELGFRLTQDSTGGWVPSFPDVTWIGGTEPTHPTDPNTAAEYIFWSDDGGTTIFGGQLGASGLASSSFATPAVVLGVTAAPGAATTAIRSDSTIVAFDTTPPADVLGVGVASATGSVAKSARRDHGHALTYHDEPLTDGASNFIFDGGDIVVVTGVPN